MERRTEGKEQGSKAKGGREEEAMDQKVFRELASYGVRRTVHG
jgi:hypothetical protein